MMKSHQATERRMKEGGKVDLGKRIASHRRRLGMKQKQLAKEMGVSKPAISYWESGQRVPKMEHMFKLAKLFDVSVDELFFGESERLQ